MAGDATLDEDLRESGILKARGLLSCLSADTPLESGDQMIVLGHPDQVATLREFARA